MIITILAMALSFAFPPMLALVMRSAMRLPPPPSPGFFSQWAWGGFGGTAASAFAAAGTGGWANVAAFAASGLTGLILWWWSRRKRRKVAKFIGEKSRAVLAKMARSMPRQSPVLRPVPQGA